MNRKQKLNFIKQTLWTATDDLKGAKWIDGNDMKYIEPQFVETFICYAFCIIALVGNSIDEVQEQMGNVLKRGESFFIIVNKGRFVGIKDNSIVRKIMEKIPLPYFMYIKK